MIPNDQALSVYRTMLAIRRFEVRVAKLQRDKRIYGAAHLYTGQEAIAAGVCANLRASDFVASTHRGHGHLIAKGGQFHRMMAELFARSTGYNKGKGGSMHIADMSRGMLGANGIVGAGIPLSTGAALSAMVRGTDQVAVGFFGNGAANQGVFLESLNIAATMSLPVIYVCENTGFSVKTDWETIAKRPDIADRAFGLGLPGQVVDGQDVTAVYDAANEAIARARRDEGPTLIECKTHRYGGHGGAWDDPGDPEELARWQALDPLIKFARTLIAGGLATEGQLQTMEQALEKDLDAAVAFAENSPLPNLEDATVDVYGDTDQTMGRSDSSAPAKPPGQSGATRLVGGASQ